MDTKIIRDTFLQYFVNRGHYLIPNRSLIPSEADSSALFINSGVHAIKPYIVGKEEPPSSKLTSDQSCIRTIDIDRVGKNARTLTYFHMLGSWSIGDYWKDVGLELAFRLLTEEFKLPAENFAITVFQGDDTIPRDQESINVWRSLGIKDHQIYLRPAEDNLWTMGDVGPCGPCTEVYIDRGSAFGPDATPGDESPRFTEIWNAGVFMTYYRMPTRELIPLKPRVIDTGAGLERLALVLQNKNTVYEVFPLSDLCEVIRAYSGNGEGNDNQVQIIADHMRAAAFIADEGIRPSNKMHGYVLRRLLRRAIYNSELLGIRDFNKMSKDMLQILNREKELKDEITVWDTITIENDIFRKTISKGRSVLEKLIASSAQGVFSGRAVFRLYDTYGFPVELTKEILTTNGLSFDEAEFDNALQHHKEISRSIDKSTFKSGLEEISEETTKYHTATHLLHQTLRITLGDHVRQAGSNITKDRMRFDFYYDKPLTEEEMKKVEGMVNQKITEDLPVSKEEMTYDQAKKRGALAVYDKSSYPEVVSIYIIGDYSCEVCTGPHVEKTGEIRGIRIIKQQNVGKGVRRLYAKLKTA